MWICNRTAIVWNTVHYTQGSEHMRVKEAAERLLYRKNWRRHGLFHVHISESESRSVVGWWDACGCPKIQIFYHKLHNLTKANRITSKQNNNKNSLHPKRKDYNRKIAVENTVFSYRKEKKTQNLFKDDYWWMLATRMQHPLKGFVLTTVKGFRASAILRVARKFSSSF